MRSIFVFIFFILQLQVWSQDFQYSQFFALPQTANPAATGFMPAGVQRIGLQYRGQWDHPGSPKGYQGFAAAYDFRTCTVRNNFWGFGLLLQNDWTAFSAVRNTSALLALAYHQKLSRNIYLAAGVGGGILQYGLQPGKLKFDAQWNGLDYDPTRGNGESFQTLSRTVADLNAGVQLYNKDRGFVLGASLFHINQPVYAFLDEEYRLGTGFTAHATLPFIPAGQDSRRWFARILYKKQTLTGSRSRQGQFIFGVLHKTKGRDRFAVLGVMTRLSGRYQEVVTADAVIPVIQLRNTTWQAALSYDFNLTRLSDRPPGGLEISFSKTFGKEGKCIECPGF